MLPLHDWCRMGGHDIICGRRWRVAPPVGKLRLVFSLKIVAFSCWRQERIDFFWSICFPSTDDGDINGSFTFWFRQRQWTAATQATCPTTTRCRLSQNEAQRETDRHRREEKFSCFSIYTYTIIILEWKNEKKIYSAQKIFHTKPCVITVPDTHSAYM